MRHWIPSRRDPIDSPSLPLPPVLIHPLRPCNVPIRSVLSVSLSVVSHPSLSLSHPLLGPVNGGQDPLSSTQSEREEGKEKEGEHFEEWTKKRAGILSKYTTSASIPVMANFLEEKVMQENKPVVVDQVKGRMELLNAVPEQQKQLMSQKEYIYTMEGNHDAMKKSWDAGERVQALKIAIQSAKLLGELSVPQFYPSAFVLITNILDTFGALVFDRLKSKGSSDGKEALPDNFVASSVNADAKETCKNWFYKTACIRELLPRFYVELSLIKSYRFLVDVKELPNVIKRLSRMIRGFGDPLVAQYARVFLCTKARELFPSGYQELILEGFNDFLFSFKQLRDSKFRGVSHIALQKISVNEYLDLFTPALQWVLQNIGWANSDDVFVACLKQYKDSCNSSSVLLHLLSSFPARVVSASATTMTQLIRESDESLTAKSKLYYTLGVALVAVAPPKEQRLVILNEVWKVVAKIQNPGDYLEIAQIFIEYLLQHFSTREINILLGDVIKHVKQDNAHKQYQVEIQRVVSNVLKYRPTFEQLLALDNFMPLLDLLERDYKFSSCKSVLESFAKNQKPTNDAVIIQTAFEVARGLHDSIDSLTFEDERREVANLIVQFIRKIEFGNDLEQQLNIFVECRAAFTNLDTVTRELVMRVTLLAMTAHRFVKGKHTKKTAAFVKACIAFCHITIPSLDDIFLRLHLMVETAQVALVNQMVGQSEGILKAAIALLPETPATIERDGKHIPTDVFMLGFLNSFSSLLLIFPGHPEHGPFHLVKGLINVVNAYPAWTVPNESKIRVYIGFLVLFASYSQVKFPYHIEKLDSNDTLYGGEAKYMEELLVFIDKLLEEILAQLASLGEKNDITSKKQQGMLALDLVNVLVSTMQMNAASATIVVKLFGLAKKVNSVDTAYLSSTLKHVQSKQGAWFQDLYSKLVAL